MSESMVSLLISVISVVVSIISSVVVTTLRNKAELRKIQTEIEQAYSKSLFDKRLESYPALCRLFSGYSKVINYKKQTVENLIEFRDEVDKWNSQYSLFFTDKTAIFSSKFRSYFKELLSNNIDHSNISERDWKDIRKAIGYFENFLRAEIGIYDTKPVGKSKYIEEAMIFLDKITKLLKSKDSAIESAS